MASRRRNKSKEINLDVMWFYFHPPASFISWNKEYLINSCRFSLLIVTRVIILWRTKYKLNRSSVIVHFHLLLHIAYQLYLKNKKYEYFSMPFLKYNWMNIFLIFKCQFIDCNNFGRIIGYKIFILLSFYQNYSSFMLVNL